MFKAIRIAVLLLILVGVALGAWRTQTRAVEWQYTLPVHVYPINGDGRPASAEYIAKLNTDVFKPVENFMREQAQRYGLAANASIEIRLSHRIDTLPPQPPSNGGRLDIAWWSLHMRYWAWRAANPPGPGPQVRIFVLYFDPEKNPRLAHSVGLQKGLMSRVNAFASESMARENNVIIAHELLHTLGATDKYDPATNQPHFPDGYAEPDLNPRHPQLLAEIMAGRIPVSESKAEAPRGLDYVLIGPRTAQEINWVARK
ncbi:MAG: hypothetical protein HYU77_08390 [Betaproteobacteria bacterium]|nr:hypothetical protein [Betaproteobacteria bacterium]